MSLSFVLRIVKMFTLHLHYPSTYLVPFIYSNSRVETFVYFLHRFIQELQTIHINSCWIHRSILMGGILVGYYDADIRHVAWRSPASVESIEMDVS